MDRLSDEERRERKQAKDRQYYQEHKQAVKDRVSAWRKANPEKRREQARRGGKAARLRDPEKLRKRFRDWAAKNPEKQRERHDEWIAKNPEKHRKIRREAGRRYENRKRGAVGEHSLEEWQNLVDSFDGLCAYCGERPGNERDHVLPLSRGGSDYVENILPACRSCNASKHDKTPEEWLGKEWVKWQIRISSRF